MRKLVLLTFVTVVAISALGLLAAGGAVEVKKLSAYGYAGRLGDVDLIVDYDVARLRGGEKFVPLLVWLGHSEKKVLHANRGSFTLTDPKGTKLVLPDVNEVRKEYGTNLMGNDWEYIRQITYGKDRFLACTKLQQVAFFPNPSGQPGVLYDQVELPNRTFFKTLLYFPNPAGKAGGNYTLTYDDQKSGTHIEVPFSIPWMESKKAK